MKNWIDVNMRKGLKLINCSGCKKMIWRNDIEGWCHRCIIFYKALSKIPYETLDEVLFGNKDQDMTKEEKELIYFVMYKSVEVYRKIKKGKAIV